MGSQAAHRAKSTENARRAIGSRSATGSHRLSTPSKLKRPVPPLSPQIANLRGPRKSVGRERKYAPGEQQRTRSRSEVNRKSLTMRDSKNHEKMKWNIQLITAAVLSIGGLIMLFCGVFIEPDGQIHESLLVGFGEVSTFSGALFGIDYVYKQKK